MEKNNKKVSNKIIEKKLNGCSELFEAEEKKKEEAKKALYELTKAIESVETLLHAE